MSTRAIILLMVVAIAVGVSAAFLPRVWDAVLGAVFSVCLVLWHLHTYKPEDPVSR